MEPVKTFEITEDGRNWEEVYEARIRGILWQSFTRESAERVLERWKVGVIVRTKYAVMKRTN